MDSGIFSAVSAEEREKMRIDTIRIQQVLQMQNQESFISSDEEDNGDFMSANEDDCDLSEDSDENSQSGYPYSSTLPSPQMVSCSGNDSAFTPLGSEALAASEVVTDSMDVHELDKPTVENLFLLNRVYQEIIDEHIRYVEQLLEGNRTRQIVLQHELDSKNNKSSGNKPKSLRVFGIPYFKDTFGLTPPPNNDVRLRAANCELDPLLFKNREWDLKELDAVMEAVKVNGKELALQPLLMRKNYIEEQFEKGSVRPEDVERQKTRLKQTIEEITNIETSFDFKDIRDLSRDIDWLKIAVNFDCKRSAEDYALCWRTYINPDINKGKWTAPEMLKLKRLANEKIYTWDEIAEKLGTNRTAFQCIQRYQQKLNKTFIKSTWTDQEDQLLKYVIERCRVGENIPWEQVMYFMDGRTIRQCYRRWNYHLDPTIKKGKFTDNEDMLVLAAVQKHGTRNWGRVKQMVPGRTDQQCRDRYNQSLSIEKKYQSWLPDDDRQLLALVEQHGHKWAEIAKVMQRGGNACLTRWLRMTEYSQKGGIKISDMVKDENYNIGSFAKNSNFRKHGIYQLLHDMLVDIVKGEPNCDMMLKKLYGPNIIMVIAKLQSEMALLKQEQEQTDALRHGHKEAMTFNKLRQSYGHQADGDKDIIDFLSLGIIRKTRGRPIHVSFAAQDDPEYAPLAQFTKKIFSGEDKAVTGCADEEIFSRPLFQANQTSMIGFKNLLLFRKRLQQVVDDSNIDLNTGVAPNGGEIQCSAALEKLFETVRASGDSTQTKAARMSETNGFSTFKSAQNRRTSRVASLGDTPEYKQLLSRFTSVFFWPAYLSSFKPKGIINDNLEKKMENSADGADEANTKPKLSAYKQIMKTRFKIKTRKPKKPWVAANAKKAHDMKRAALGLPPVDKPPSKITPAKETKKRKKAVERFTDPIYNRSTRSKGTPVQNMEVDSDPITDDSSGVSSQPGADESGLVNESGASLLGPDASLEGSMDVDQFVDQAGGK